MKNNIKLKTFCEIPGATNKDTTDINMLLVMRYTQNT